MTYAEHRANIRRAERAGWARLTDEQRAEAIKARENYLRDEIVRRMETCSEFVARIKGCPECYGVELPARHSWPSYFFCDCGRATACCRWLPDEIERMIVF